jgi:hypothetical protein
MAIKTFTDLTTLPASDINTYLANSGLVYVTSGPLSTATTDFVGCFSSIYRNYRIVIDQISWSGTADLYFRMLSGSTPATTAEYFWAYNGLSAIAGGSNSNGNGQVLGYLGTTNNGANNLAVGSASFDIYAPNVAARTLFTGTGIGVISEYVSKTGIAAHNLTTAYTGIRLMTGSAVTMTGNVTIYGYRQL